jgi:hypothetical protein
MGASSCPGELLEHDRPLCVALTSNTKSVTLMVCQLQVALPMQGMHWWPHTLYLRFRYSGLLERHADLVLGAAAEALHGRGRSRSVGGGGAVKQVLRRLLQVRIVHVHWLL